MDKIYVLVKFPESQLFMEEEWFEDEAIPFVGGEKGSYFIPEDRLLCNEYISSRIEELSKHIN